MDAKKTLRAKARWEPHKDTAFCFEQFLEAAPHKTDSVRPPALFHLTNRLSKRTRYVTSAKYEYVQYTDMWNVHVHRNPETLDDFL